jgi:outer membrane protein OmpA-like peptidoglycan-associated protein
MAKRRVQTVNRVSGVSVLFFMILLTGGAVGAQTAAEMDALLETPAVNFAQASRFVLAAAEYPVGADPAAGTAYALALEKGWLPKKAAPDKPLKLGELCFLIMKALDIKGSFLYALFPGPRYAFRELDYLRLIPGRRDPGLRVSGEELLRMLEMVTIGDGIELAETPPPEPAVPPAETPPPAVDAAAAAEREQIAQVIRVELEQHDVADTSVRVAEEGIVISMNNIQFLPDSVRLTAGEMVKLREISAILLRYPGRNILVGGHTAMAGTEAGRLQISRERAQAVADFLIALEVRRPGNITVRGYGAARPLGDNATEAGQAINRRVEITLLDEEQP